MSRTSEQQFSKRRPIHSRALEKGQTLDQKPSSISKSAGPKRKRRKQATGKKKMDRTPRMISRKLNQVSTDLEEETPQSPRRPPTQRWERCQKHSPGRIVNKCPDPASSCPRSMCHAAYPWIGADFLLLSRVFRPVCGSDTLQHHASLSTLAVHFCPHVFRPALSC